MVRAALTGHLVFSTLHTNDAPGAIPRLIDMGVDPFLLPASLLAVLAQRLVRTICPDCKEEVKDPASILETTEYPAARQASPCGCGAARAARNAIAPATKAGRASSS